VPIAGFDDFQHNRKLREIHERTAGIVREALKAKKVGFPAVDVAIPPPPPNLLTRLWNRIFGDKRSGVTFTSVIKDSGAMLS